MHPELKAGRRTEKFRYEKVLNLEDALGLAGTDNRRILAGGTDLLLKMKHGTARPQALLDISKIEELSHIREDGKYIRIGACVRVDELLKNDLLCSQAPILCRVAGEIGSPEVRNRGTVGGNLCSARANCGTCFLPGCKSMTGDRTVRPCQNASYSDLLLPLAAYGASVVLKREKGERTVPVRQFLRSNGTLELNIDEILSEIYFPKPVADGWGYARLRHPPAMGLPFLCVIAASRNDAFDLTVGGSTKYIHTFEKVVGRGMTGKIASELLFNESLYFSQDYRKKITPVFISEAMEYAISERER
jgi:CO/xanthine dehydrogenase FAD-binding subunit